MNQIIFAFGSSSILRLHLTLAFLLQRGSASSTGTSKALVYESILHNTQLQEIKQTKVNKKQFRHHSLHSQNGQNVFVAVVYFYKST